MENPATWGRAEYVIREAYGQWSADRDNGVIGLSLYRVITDALRKAGLLKEEEGR